VAIASGSPIWGDNLAIDDASVYWTQYGEYLEEGGGPEYHAVWKAPLGGGTPTEVWRTPGVVLLESGMAVANGHVFVPCLTTQNIDGSGSSAIFSVATDGGDASTVATTDSTGLRALAVDSTSVYAASGGKVFRVLQTGGPPETLWSGPARDGVTSLVVSDGQLFLTSSSADAGVTVLVPVDRGVATTLAALGGSGVAVDRTNVYVAAGDGVFAIARSGGAPRRLASGLPNPADLAVDATGVYVASAGGNYPGGGRFGGVISRIPLDGGLPVTLASGQTNFGSMVANNTTVFWATLGTVMRVGKCSR
jgi:hypothetical protein